MHPGTLVGLLLSCTGRLTFHTAISRSVRFAQPRDVSTRSCTRPPSCVAEYMHRMSPQHTDAIASSHRMIAYMLRAHPQINCRISFISVTSRTKSVYSSWMKMQRLGCAIDEILDLIAVRIVLSSSDAAPAHACSVLTVCAVHGRSLPSNANDGEFAPSRSTEDQALCYNVMDLVHCAWNTMPMTTKDFIEHPKPNGYRSLHTTVMVGVQPVEIQIRTVEMHNVAEHGTAAHAVYKATQYTE